MPLSVPSALIRYKRLQRNWSLEGLCEGICTISYLSKIEQGKADPAPHILQALMQRLEICWHDGEEAEEARKLTEAWWEAVSSLDHKEISRCQKQLEEHREAYVNGPEMLNLLLLEKLGFNRVQEEKDRVLCAFEDCFTLRQRAWYWLIQGKYREALTILPVPYVYLECGSKACFEGQYVQAVEDLLRCCALAAEEGQAQVLLMAKILLGNCYSDQHDYAAMQRHYRAAERLARDLHEPELLETIRYNTAATEMQLGHYEDACQYFESMEDPYVLALHKLAICYEKLNRPQKALETLEKAEQTQRLYGEEADFPDRKWLERFCALVRFRLEHPAYLHNDTYGKMLLSAYRDMQKELPNGYALFHQPWVEEWYVANRQYKQAYELRNALS